MKRKLFIPIKLFAIALAIFTPIAATYAQKDVTQPGDPIIASSANSPGSEGVANAIDGQPTKYLNRDSGVAGGTSGFVVTPSVGATRVTGLAMQSANDSPNRDPKIVTLEGSNDTAITDYASGTWELIVRLDDIPAYGARFETQTFNFPNFKAYKHYRWTIVETAGAANGCCMQIAEVELLGSVLPGDVTQPGDPIIASSANSPGSEGVANAIDGQPTKYLNRDSGVAGGTSGFVVSPSIGATVVTGIAMQSANDSPNRDPKIVTLEGSNDDAIADYASGTWTLIQRIDDIPAYAARFQTQTFLFDNFKPYKHYRWTIVETAGAANGCCMQIAEVELLGGGAPKDITQPGDPIIASSANSPGSEGVANAIDGQPTKYLNRDSGVAGGTSGFVVTPSIGETTITGIAMQSANDSPNRDPKIITIEGSNDTEASYTSGTWELITRIDNIPEYTARFQTQTFYFQNTKSYKHYRWTIVETAGAANGCCMQIAEVELLAVTQGADCNKARFLTQPVNTPVLDGAEATFFTVVNGPWPVQWMKNGKAIPGATSLSYTTSAVTAANAADVYKVEIVGCEASAEVKAEIFKPSAIKSIGFSFSGGGANGAPTAMNDTDIAGVHPQAHWNNLAGGSGISDIIVDSDNAESFAFLEWQTSGQWGAGTGSASATQRMLNGLVYANPGTPATLTFGNLPAGNHSVILYTVGIPLQFQNVNYSVNGSKVYTRIVNADEYNAAPGFFRGTSTSATAPSLATYVRFDNVSAASGTITIEFETTTTGFDRGGPINAVQILLNSPAAGTPPSITADPQPAAGAKDGAVRLSVSAQGADLTYQWRKNGRNLPNGGNITGAQSADLTISSLSEADVASYSVAVFNPAGSVISKTVAVRVATFKIDESLVGYWKFDETAGSTAANAAAGAPAGAITGTASWGAGKVGNALRLDGSSTYVFVPNYTKAKRQMAASGWVNVGTSVFEGVAFLRNAIGNLGIGLGSTGNSLEGQFEFGLIEDLAAGGMRLTAGIGAGPNVVRATQPGLFTLGSWQHVAFSADGAQLRIYVNGAEVASTDYITDINPPHATLPWLSIGVRLNKEDVLDAASPLLPDLTLPYFMAGQIDDLALWTRGLSADEVSLIFAAGNAGNALTTVTPAAPVEPPAESGALDVRVASGLDDSEEHLTEGNAIDITSSDLELGAEGGAGDTQEIGIRFQGVNVPAGKLITKASIQFTVDEADDEPTSLRIYGELAANAAEFNTDVGNITGRAKTKAFVDWSNIPVWNAASIGTAGPDQLTPDLSAIVQEIIGQAGWNAGNAIAFIITPNPGGERTAESFDGDAGAAPLLHIEYGPGGGGGGLNTNGLVAYWNFDGHLSDAIKDFHGTARGATPVAFGDGKAGFGKAITLNGANFVEITGGNNKELQFPGGSMSIAGWFKVGTFDKNWQALISKGEQLNYRVARRSGEASLAYAGGVGEGTNNAPDVNDGNWHHFTAVSDATVAEFGTALYIDGTRYEVNATKPVLADGTLNLMIGENPGALNRQWNGSIDDISIWNRVLTAGEVTALYAGGTGVAISTLPGVKAPTPPPPPFDGITADKSAGPSLAIPGTGLKGEYWQRGVNTIATDGNTVDANRIDTQIAGFGAASGTFTAKVLNYLGNDLSEMPAWLGDDAGSYSGTPGNLDDGAFRFTGFLNIAAPGIINIGTTSDDGTRIKIAGKDVINNDGGHGDATVDADVAFEAAGVYPIEVTYFNGDWTSDGDNHSGNPDPSVHGGANFHLRINGNNVGTGELDLFFTTADGLPPVPKALLVVGTASVPDLNPSDAGVKAHLESLGFAVTVANAPESTTADADGKALIVTSSTVNSGDVANKFQTVAVPVVNWEQALEDNYLMTGNAGTDHATAAAQTTLQIVGAGHPLAGDLANGVATVATANTDYSWGLPIASATRIAHIVGNPDQVAVYGYETGAAMFGGAIAPARRVMLFGGDGTFEVATGDGRALYDAAFRWAAGLPPAPARPAIALGLNFGASEPNGANTFVVAATESAGAPGVAQANWNNLSGPTGTGADLVADARGAAVPTGISVKWVSNGSWASTGRSENNGTNFKPGTADFNLMGGYLDTGAATTTTVTVSGVDAGIAAAGYDVYVYANGGVAAGRAGAYRIVNAATGEAITEYVLATSATAPTDYVQVPTGLAAGVYGAGTHIVFGGIKATSIRVEATTAGGLGAGSPPRAPINAIQLTSPSMASGGGGGGMIGIARSATGITLTFDGTLQSADAVGGPYTDVAGATSPAAISFSGSGKFYRSRQ